MSPDAVKLLNLMFNPGEAVCVSPNQYSYHSIPLGEVVKEQVRLVPTVESAEKRKMAWEDTFEWCPSDQMLLVAINPINGYRSDSSVTAFRSFMVEMDTGTGTKEDLQAQADYIKKSGLPFSACIYSGGKSLHYLVTLDQDLPSEKEWRHIAEWILGCLTAADQLTKNPSRSIRIPGAFRAEKGKSQVLLALRERIKLETLQSWLNQNPDAEPRYRDKKIATVDQRRFDMIRPWARNLLRKGLDPTKSRNGQWYAIALEYALAGFSEDDTINLLNNYFTPSRDFPEREWLTAIGSAFKRVRSGRKS